MLFCVVFYVSLVSKIALKTFWEEIFPDEDNNDKNNSNGRNNNDDTVSTYWLTYWHTDSRICAKHSILFHEFGTIITPI